MRTVLVANRGEIAVRVVRACREAGLRTVAVYSDADRGAPHVLAADQAIAVGPPPARESYLNIEALLGAARTAGADAVHPGYGFLAESAAFAEAVEAAGLVWIGPPPQAIATMGDKLAARATVARAGVPLVPGTELVAADVATARRQIAALGYPVLVKAAGGGGGTGGWLHQRRHRRVPARRRRPLLLPRDEHPRAGRASRHGARDGHRHRRRAAPHRRGRDARVRPVRRRPAWPCDRGPALRGGPRTQLLSESGTHPRLARALGPRRARRFRRRSGHGRARRLRPDAREDLGLGGRPRDGRATAPRRARGDRRSRTDHEPRLPARHPRPSGVPRRRHPHGLPDRAPRRLAPRRSRRDGRRDRGRDSPVAPRRAQRRRRARRGTD